MGADKSSGKLHDWWPLGARVSSSELQFPHLGKESGTDPTRSACIINLIMSTAGPPLPQEIQSALDDRYFENCQSWLFFWVRFFPWAGRRHGEEVTLRHTICPNSLPPFLRCVCLSLQMMRPCPLQRGRKQPSDITEVPVLWLSHRGSENLPPLFFR